MCASLRSVLLGTSYLAMSSGASPFHLPSRSYPSKRDLDRIASAIRTVAAERGLSDRIVDRYEAWIFVFLAWCLRAPPHHVGRDRVGDFWTALTQRRVHRWKVCDAMDALGFLFGALGGPEDLSFPGTFVFGTARETRRADTPAEPPGSIGANGDSPASKPIPGRTRVHRPNPTIEASNPPSGTDREGRDKDLSSYLPDGPVPMGIDARSEVPTSGREETPGEGNEPVPNSPPNNRTSGSGPGGRDGPKTLFNPEGKASVPRNEASPKEPSTGRRSTKPGSPAQAASPKKDRPVSPRKETGRRNSRRVRGAQSAGSSGEEPDPHSQSSPRLETKMTSLEIPEPVADRVATAARHLGLPPQVFAARALDLVCNETGVARPGPLDSETPDARTTGNRGKGGKPKERDDDCKKGDHGSSHDPTSFEMTHQSGMISPKEAKLRLIVQLLLWATVGTAAYALGSAASSIDPSTAVMIGWGITGPLLFFEECIGPSAE